ncbi:MAG: M14 family metallopeptidase [Aureispira sp.]
MSLITRFPLILVACCMTFGVLAQYPPALLTVPEKTAFERTSSSDEVLDFIAAIAQTSPSVHVDTIAQSDSGQVIPMVILARPKVTSPAEARASGKTLVYVQGNIHGGEVEGKEVLLFLMREILLGKEQALLEHQILLFTPNYNPDGNNNLSPKHRSSQEHCPHLAGGRRSGGDWDLNRDGIKLDALETQGLFEHAIVPWDPDVFIDLHTTNGVWHANELTYAHSYHTIGDPGTSLYTRDSLLPAVQKTLLDKYDLHTDIYGGYSLAQGWPPKNLYTYNHHPRYLVNQFGLRNRMAILSETFAHDKFYHRINSAHKFVLEVLRYTNQHATAIRQVNLASEAATIAQVKAEAGRLKKGVRFQKVPEKQPMTLRTYNYLTYQDSTEQTRYVRTHEVIRVKDVNNYSAFEPILYATLPKAYVFPANLAYLVPHLQRLGIQVETLSTAQSYQGEQFKVRQLELSKQAFERHHLVTLAGKFEAANQDFPAGSFYVTMEQPLANLIFYLLEPQSDDGLVTWNFLDKPLYALGVLEAPVIFPIFKVF